MDGAPLANDDLADDFTGEQPFGAPMPRAFRLADAERIAASRLDGAGEGSLKEALATMIVPPASPSGGSLTERLQQIEAAGHGTVPPIPHEIAAPVDIEHGLPSALPERTPEDISHEVDLAAREPDFGWMNAVPPAHAVPFFEDRETGEDWLREAPVIRPTPVSATGWATPMSAPVEFAPGALDEATEAAPQATLAAEISVAQEIQPAGTTADEGASAVPVQLVSAEPAQLDDPSPLQQGVLFSDTPDDHPASAALGLPDDPNLEPLVTAYAASAKLAADAAAASQALFELQKLLNDQLLEASPELNEAMEAHGFAGLAAIPAAGQPADLIAPEGSEGEEPFQADALMAALAAPQQPVRAANQPPPLPAALPSVLLDVPHEELPKCVVRPERSSSGESSESASRSTPAAVPAQPATRHVAVVPSAQLRSASTEPRTPRRHTQPPVPAPKMQRQRPPFDFRGFAAGFALSGAIGVVLYFVMTTS